ncbi:hypothetical protein ILUMI_11886 [Ignelater luminosus]|uniref:Uncharacterized protein n=1 Tax=Ignelater luminosus TaxID=2038154 RepID=A0A8K0CVE7_IGNLU|nr:hypothetical protein ILUMI_11886 [Ignelater luminosus]
MIKRKVNPDDIKDERKKTRRMVDKRATLVQETFKQIDFMKHYNDSRLNSFATFEPLPEAEALNGTRAAQDAKRRNLQANATKRKVSSSVLTTEELSKVVSIWDENTPSATKHFLEEKDNMGVNTGRIGYNPIFTKTSQEGSKKLADSKWLTMNNYNSNVCPVRLLKKLLEQKTKFISIDRIFLTPNQNWKNSLSKG